MDEDRFNLSVRRFLKEVGVTSQREIEKAVRSALDEGRLGDVGELDARMTLEVSGVQLVHVVEGRIDTGGD
ncbi:MAG: hypothetical protein GIW95_04810 [Candidatus Eremiobacteraeota bacterium]|nr:hypothetical protein [Candidatus Eremiobacteraeota bacterium]